MEQKSKVVGQCTPEELKAFRLWDARKAAAEATAQQMMRATTAALNDMQQKLVEEHHEFYAAVEKAHGLDSNGCYAINKKTGEITECKHETRDVHPILAAILAARHASEDETIPPVLDKTKVN